MAISWVKSEFSSSFSPYSQSKSRLFGLAYTNSLKRSIVPATSKSQRFQVGCQEWVILQFKMSFKTSTWSKEGAMIYLKKPLCAWPLPPNRPSSRKDRWKVQCYSIMSLKNLPSLPRVVFHRSQTQATRIIFSGVALLKSTSRLRLKFESKADYFID